MCKEYFIQAYEQAIEDIVWDKDLGYEEAQVILEDILSRDPSYLDGYLTWDYTHLEVV